MKKLMLLILVSIFTFSLVGCGNDSDDGGNNNAVLPNIKTTLEAEGYVFEQRNADAITYYNNNAVNTKYSIDVTVTDLYIAYIDGSQAWMELIEFSSAAEADEFTSGIDTLDTSGLLYHKEGSVVVITYTQTTIDALN